MKQQSDWWPDLKFPAINLWSVPAELSNYWKHYQHNIETTTDRKINNGNESE